MKRGRLRFRRCGGHLGASWGPAYAARGPVGFDPEEACPAPRFFQQLSKLQGAPNRSCRVELSTAAQHKQWRWRWCRWTSWVPGGSGPVGWVGDRSCAEQSLAATGDTGDRRMQGLHHASLFFLHRRDVTQGVREVCCRRMGLGLCCPCCHRRRRCTPRQPWARPVQNVQLWQQNLYYCTLLVVCLLSLPPHVCILQTKHSPAARATTQPVPQHREPRSVACSRGKRARHQQGTEKARCDGSWMMPPFAEGWAATLANNKAGARSTEQPCWPGATPGAGPPHGTAQTPARQRLGLTAASTAS
jgi:hypothetical protein